MHGLGPGVAACLHDAVDDEIGLGGRCGPDIDGLVRHLDVQRVAVGVGIDRDGLDPIRRAVLMTRQAISPRLAIRIL